MHNCEYKNNAYLIIDAKMSICINVHANECKYNIYICQTCIVAFNVNVINAQMHEEKCK